MGAFNVFWHDLLGRECCGEQSTLQARIKRQGDWALKCTSGHDLERRFIDTINDGFFEQLVLVPMREDVTPDLGLCSAVLTLQVGLLGGSLMAEERLGSSARCFLACQLLCTPCACAIEGVWCPHPG